MNYDPAKVNALSEQFLDYQMLNDHDIPDSIWQNACNYDEKIKYYSIDISRGYIGQMKDCIGKIGRVFSMVKKNETPFRPSMGFNTLGFILTVKLANPNATKFKPEKTPLKSAKSETLEYNKRHSSSSSSITTKNVKKKMSLFFF